MGSDNQKKNEHPAEASAADKGILKPTNPPAKRDAFQTFDEILDSLKEDSPAIKAKPKAHSKAAAGKKPASSSASAAPDGVRHRVD